MKYKSISLQIKGNINRRAFTPKEIVEAFESFINDRWEHPVRKNEVNMKINVEVGLVKVLRKEILLIADGE